jgi:SAM-dependent methyltransferase
VDINYQAIEEKVRAGYRQVTPEYRRDDEVEITTANHKRLDSLLKQICWWFPDPIDVLDVGCGTGRYFHCLKHVRRLVGIDISEDMLAAATNPVLKESISVEEIELMRGNAYLTTFYPGSFHFIYSLGMFGHGCPVTVEILNRFHEWLIPGGKLLFNVVDVAGLPWYYRTRRRLRAMLYPCLPQMLQAALDTRARRAPFFAFTRSGLLEVLGRTRFTEFIAVSHACKSPLWSGRHLECLATKT